jgi:hypothetical protein
MCRGISAFLNDEMERTKKDAIMGYFRLLLQL